MGINRIDFAGTTLIDISQDTATESDVLTGKTFHKADGTQATGSATAGTDTSDATATAADILTGKTAYAQGSKLTGSCDYDADTSDATATASDILTGKTAYVNGSKLTGSYTPSEDFEYLVDYDKKDTLHTYDLTNIPHIRGGAFKSCKSIQSVIGQVEKIEDEAFYSASYLQSIDLTKVKKIGLTAFAYCARLDPGLIDLQDDGANGGYIGSWAFRSLGSSLSSNITVKLKASGQNHASFYGNLFSGSTKVDKIYIYPCTVNPWIDSDAFAGITNLTDIYVPWSEGDVNNSPWGAGSGVTIHYDTTYDAQGEPE